MILSRAVPLSTHLTLTILSQAGHEGKQGSAVAFDGSCQAGTWGPEDTQGIPAQQLGDLRASISVNTPMSQPPPRGLAGFVWFPLTWPLPPTLPS